MTRDNKQIGSSLDDFLAEEGLLESSQSVAIKRVLSWQLTQFMKKQNLSKAAIAARMNTSRSALDLQFVHDQHHVRKPGHKTMCNFRYCIPTGRSSAIDI